MDTRELLDKMAENLSVRQSFGVAYERDGVLVIPVALVAGGGGGGEGPIQPRATRHSRAVEAAEPTKHTPPDGQPPIGTGGGFGGLVLPMGAYVVNNDQVRWVPAYDVTLITLAGLSVLRFLMGLLRHRRQHHHA